MSETPQSIKDIIKKIEPRVVGERRRTEEKIFKEWQKAAGKKLVGHSELASFRKKRLVINFESSSWLFEFSLNKSAILEKLKNALGKNNIKELYGRIGQE